MQQNTPTSRYSTAEVASRLFCSYVQARQILKAAGIPYTRVGNALLWNGEAVELLITALDSIKMRYGQ